MRSVKAVKVGVAVLATFGTLFVLTGCAGGAEESTGSGKPASETVVVDFKGKPLTCVIWNGSHGEEGRTCDFVAYHEQYGFTE